MPTPPLSQEAMQEALDAVQAHGTVTAAAEALGINRATFQHRYAMAKAKFLDPGIADAMEAAKTSIVPSVTWIKTKNEDGTSYSVMVRPQQDPGEIADTIRAALEGMEAAPVIPAPEHVNEDLLTIYPIADAHIGMMAWGRETGEDYDSSIAVDRLKTWVARCVAASPASHTAVILDVGDLLHADDHTNQTPGSKHILDVDTRYYRTIEMTIAAMVTAINTALEKHQNVIVRILPGNHDKTAYIAILFALAERYRDNPRVEVQKDPREFYAQQFGKVMLAAHHGDKAKAQRMVLDMADAFPEMWGATRHRFLWTGHLHHHKSEDIGGVQWEQLRALTARDAYAASHAYSARAQLQAVTYHRDLGEVSRVKVGSF